MILRMLNHAYYRVFGDKTPRPYEAACIAAWQEHLDEDSNHRLTAQRKQFGLIGRMSADKLLCFFPSSYSKPVLPEDVLFPERRECCVATVYLKAPAEKSKNGPILKADITLAGGRFFGLEFNKSPITFFGADQLDHVQPVVVKVDVFAHPLPVAQASSQIAALTAHIDSALPEDYLAQCGTATAALGEGVVMYAIAEVYKLVWPLGSYYIFAERSGECALGVKEGDYSGEPYFVDLSAAMVEPMGRIALTSALEQLV